MSRQSAPKSVVPKLGKFKLRMKLPAYAKIGLIFLGCLLAVIATYRHTNMKLLRAENGAFQRFAHDPPEQRRQLIRLFWTTQNHSHYIPIAFTSEFEFTRLAGMRVWLWRSRQVAALALVATLMFLLARFAARVWQVRDMAANSFAAGVTAVLIFQPFMNELIAWPILFIHLIWISLVLFTLWSLVRLVASPTESLWVWLAAIGAYGSMHFLGLGITVVAATVLILSFLLLGVHREKLNEFRPIKSQLMVALILLVILGGAHALCMVLLPSNPPSPVSNPGSHATFAEAAAFLALYPLAIATSFGGVNSIVPVNREVFGDPWPFGIVIAAAAIWIGLRFYRAALLRKTPAALTRLILYVFSTIAFFGWITMVGIRQIYETDRLGDYGFLVGPRYIVPISFLLVGIVLTFILPFLRQGRTVTTAFSIMIAAAAFWTHYNYDKNVYLRTRLLRGVSHVEAWREIVATARESRNAHLKVPNIPMAALSEGFKFLDLKFFEPMLRDDLQLPAGEHCEFIDWVSCRQQERAAYDAAVPSLRKVIETLGLEETVGSRKN